MCFRPLKQAGFRSLLTPPPKICHRCYQSLDPKPVRFEVIGVKGHALYEYRDGFRSALYRYKGTGDIVLKGAFLTYPIHMVKAFVFRCTALPVPSSFSHDEARGFNQVKEIINELGIPMIDCFEKVEESKQSALSAAERASVGKTIRWKEGASIKGKNVVVIDDVFTTGSTLKACLRLAMKHHPRKVTFLVLARTPKRKRALARCLPFF